MQSLEQISENIFIGMNNRYPYDQLDPGMFASLSNVLIDQQSLQKRQGTTPVASSMGNYSILGLSAYEPVGGTKYLFACLNGSSNAELQYWAGSGNFTVLTGSNNITYNLPMNFVQAANYLYGFNGTDVISVNSSLTYTHNPASVPAGLVACWFANYLFVANTTVYPNRLFFSNLGDPTTFGASNYVDINPDDGDEITGLKVFNNELFVFKNNTIWSVSGQSGSTFASTTTLSQNTNSLIYGYGTPSQNSIVSTGKDLYYLSYSGGIPHIRSFVQTQYASTLEQGVISYDIEGTMQTLNVSNLNLVAGAYDGKYCYWSVPDVPVYNNLVLVLEPSISVKSKTMTHRCWSLWSGFSAAQFAVSDLAGNNTIYFGDGTATGNVSQLNAAGYADNGNPVVMDVQTRGYTYALSHRNKFKYVYMTYDSVSSANVVVGATLNQSTGFTTQATVSQQGATGMEFGTAIFGTSVFGGQLQMQARVPFQQLTGNYLQLDFNESSANSVNIRHWEIYGKPRGLRAS